MALQYIVVDAPSYSYQDAAPLSMLHQQFTHSCRREVLFEQVGFIDSTWYQANHQSKFLQDIIYCVQMHYIENPSQGIFKQI